MRGLFLRPQRCGASKGTFDRVDTKSSSVTGIAPSQVCMALSALLAVLVTELGRHAATPHPNTGRHSATGSWPAAEHPTARRQRCVVVLCPGAAPSDHQSHVQRASPPQQCAVLLPTARCARGERRRVPVSMTAHHGANSFLWPAGDPRSKYLAVHLAIQSGCGGQGHHQTHSRIGILLSPLH